MAAGISSWYCALYWYSHCSVFDHLQYAKMEGKDLIHFIMWMTWVSNYSFFVLNLEHYVFHFENFQNSCKCLGQKLQDKTSSSFFWWETPPPSVYLGRHWQHSNDKNGLCFCIRQAIKNWTVGRSGNKATVYRYCVHVIFSVYYSIFCPYSDTIPTFPLMS